LVRRRLWVLVQRMCIAEMIVFIDCCCCWWWVPPFPFPHSLWVGSLVQNHSQKVDLNMSSSSFCHAWWPNTKPSLNPSYSW
jgi:hypothetical protein